MSTGSALSAMICRPNDTSERAPHMMPVTSATSPAVNQTTTQIWLSEMPTDSAALWLSATARSARPMRVLWKNTASAATIRPAIAAAAMSIFWKVTRPPSMCTSMAPRGSHNSPAIMAFGRPPKMNSPSPMMK